METVKTACAYHPGKTMITSCQTCRKPICELDVNKGRYNRDLCYFCYKESVQQGYWLALILSLLLLFFSLIMLIAASRQPVGALQAGNNDILSAEFFGFFGVILLIVCISMYIYYQNKLKEAIAVYSSQSVIISASVSNQVLQSIKATETQKNVQQYTSWLFSNADATKNPKNTAITLTNDENHFCSICGAICNSIDVFCSNCGNKIN